MVRRLGGSRNAPAGQRLDRHVRRRRLVETGRRHRCCASWLRISGCEIGFPPLSRVGTACTFVTSSAIPVFRMSGCCSTIPNTPVTTDLTFLPGVHPAIAHRYCHWGGHSDHPRSGGRYGAGHCAGAASDRDVCLAARRCRRVASGMADACSEAGGREPRQPPAKHLPTPAEQQRFTLDLSQGWAYKRAGQPDRRAGGGAGAARRGRPCVGAAGPGNLADAQRSHRPSGSFCAANSPFRRTGRRARFILTTSGSVNGARTFLDGKPLFGGRDYGTAQRSGAQTVC